MKHTLTAIAWLGLGSLSSVSAALPEPVDEALPLVGTGGHGHTFPGATLLFGFVQLSSDTPMGGWDGCAGYHYSDSFIFGFSHTHLSGTGIGDLGDVLVLPVTGKLQESETYQPMTVERLRSGFSHDNETATPGYYKVLLSDKYQVLAELTATARAGMHRYTFPDTGERHLLVDLVHGARSTALDGSIKIEGGNMITGHRHTTGWDRSRFIYYALECSQPWSSIGLDVDGQPVAMTRRRPRAGTSGRTWIFRPPPVSQF